MLKNFTGQPPPHLKVNTLDSGSPRRGAATLSIHVVRLSPSGNKFLVSLNINADFQYFYTHATSMHEVLYSRNPGHSLCFIFRVLKKLVFKEILLKTEPSIFLNFNFQISSLLKANSIWCPQLSSQLNWRDDTVTQFSRCFFF